ncbi:MAG: isopentenyl-diphosphate Delta-isomerase [Bacteroidales bacterium]
MNDKKLNVVLIDESDNVVGYMEKIEAHEKGLLHRAISVFLFNEKGEWLLQKRASGKYHCPGLWSNSCCTHPFANESYENAALRRTNEELGLSPELKEIHRFIYRAELDQSLVEHEYDVVFMGITKVDPDINPEEVSTFRYISSEGLAREISTYPENFTPWFRILYHTIKDAIRVEQS